jgi:hypothetical protein
VGFVTNVYSKRKIRIFTLIRSMDFTTCWLSLFRGDGLIKD